MGNRIITFEEFKRRFDIVSTKEYEYVEGYKSMSNKIQVRHISCDTVFNPVATAFINTGTKCPKCKHVSIIMKTTEEYRQDIINETNGEYNILSEYVSYNDDITFIHNVCGRSYNGRPSFFKRGNRCPYCSNRSYAYTIEELQVICNNKYRDYTIQRYDTSKRIIILNCDICKEMISVGLKSLKDGNKSLFNHRCCISKINIINRFSSNISSSCKQNSNYKHE